MTSNAKVEGKLTVNNLCTFFKGRWQVVFSRFYWKIRQRSVSESYCIIIYWCDMNLRALVFFIRIRFTKLNTTLMSRFWTNFGAKIFYNRISDGWPLGSPDRVSLALLDHVGRVDRGISVLKNSIIQTHFHILNTFFFKWVCKWGLTGTFLHCSMTF